MSQIQQTIPWSTAEQWSQACLSIMRTVESQRVCLNSTQNIAEQICRLLRYVDDGLNTLCSATCTSCTAVCCSHATLWYDFHDLLYMYLSLKSFPKEQISKKEDNSCVHLLSDGCSLKRWQRPFICTWYVCHSQKEFLRSPAISEGLQEVVPTIDKIKSLRKQMEKSFLECLSL